MGKKEAEEYIDERLALLNTNIPYMEGEVKKAFMAHGRHTEAMYKVEARIEGMRSSRSDLENIKRYLNQ